MSVCRARSLTLFGIDALPVEVEVDVSSGLPGFSIVGLPDAAVQEARERVRVAISNSGFKFPTKKVIVNLAPANLRKEGPVSAIPLRILAYASRCFYNVLLPFPWCTWCTSVVYVSIHKHPQPLQLRL
jgi:magnesium chelatase family protein